MFTRRQFLQSGLVSSAALIAADQVLLASEAPNQSGWPIAIFEKVFEGLSYDELAEAIAEIDADGVEATIRPKGHIEPEAAADQVPEMCEALKNEANGSSSRPRESAVRISPTRSRCYVHSKLPV